MVKRTSPLWLACVVGCAGALPPSGAVPDQNVPFRISSLGVPFLVQGAFWGSVRTGDRLIDVQVDSAQISRPTSRVLPLAFLRLRGALATRRGSGSWRITARSEPVSLPDTVEPSFVLGPLHLTIPKPSGFDATTDYIVFQFEFPLPGAPHTSAETATAYACGAPGMLVGADTSASPLGSG